MPYTPAYSAGDILTASAMNSIGEAWTSFGSTASWTASVGNPSPGNATWDAAYCQINKLIVARYRLGFGSTTSAGSGTYRFDLPVTAKASTHPVGGQGACFDGLVYYACFPTLQSTSKVQLATMALDLSFTYKLVNPADPFNFGNGDTIMFTIIYEAA